MPLFVMPDLRNLPRQDVGRGHPEVFEKTGFQPSLE